METFVKNLRMLPSIYDMLRAVVYLNSSNQIAVENTK